MNLHTQLVIFGLLCMVTGMILSHLIDRHFFNMENPKHVGEIVILKENDADDAELKLYASFNINAHELSTLDMVSMRVIQKDYDPQE